jgi:exonuclease VII large subunit
MTETPASQPSRPQPPAEFYWGISYLREDIQDLRQELRSELRTVHTRIDQTNQRLDEFATAQSNRLDQTAKDLVQRIDGVNISLSNRIDQLGRELGQRIDGTNQRAEQLGKDLSQRIDESNQRIDGTNQRIDEKYELLAKRFDSRFSSLVMAMIAIGGLIVSLVGVVIVMVRS